MAMCAALAAVCLLTGCVPAVLQPRVVTVTVGSTVQHIDSGPSRVDALAARGALHLRVFDWLRLGLVADIGGSLQSSRTFVRGTIGLDLDFAAVFLSDLAADPSQNAYPSRSRLILRAALGVGALTFLAQSDAPAWESSSVLRVGPALTAQAGVRLSPCAAVVLEYGMMLLQTFSDVQSDYHVGLALEWAP